MKLRRRIRSPLLSADDPVNRVTVLGTLTASVRMIKWLLVVMFVITIGSIIRAEAVQNSADDAKVAGNRATVAAEEARDAARKASQDLADAIEQSQGGASIDPALIARSLQASIRAECILDREYNNPERECD